nr:MAG TPA: hypothetical protein [Caudoviricetes sp.]
MNCFFVVPDLFFFDTSFHNFFCDSPYCIFPWAYYATVNLDFDFHFYAPLHETR